MIAMKVNWKSYVSFSAAYAFGMIAPPAMPMIKIADPFSVKFPRPEIPSGKIAGHINAFASPSKATIITEVYPVVRKAPTVNTIPNRAEIRKANC